MTKQLQITLVVEDDRANRAGLVRLLQYSGHLVEQAETVAEAIVKLKAQPAVVLLDLHLPDGTGADVLEHIRRLPKQPKVCVLTGSATSETLAEIRNLKPDGIILKPFHPDQLLEWVNGAHACGEAPAVKRDRQR